MLTLPARRGSLGLINPVAIARVESPVSAGMKSDWIAVAVKVSLKEGADTTKVFQRAEVYGTYE